MTPDMTPG